MELLTVGVMARSRKADEWRLPIHPRHLDRIDAALRPYVFLEEGYGERFGITDEQLAPLVAGLKPRGELIADCDVVLLPKPLAEDLAELRDGQVLWGWPHCVQSTDVTQLAIDRRLTLVAFEAMNHWGRDGSFKLHVFHKNNEMAGYCSVLHAMQLAGITGDYGRPLKAAVIGFGATGRGAVTVLNAHGVHNVDVLTQREVPAVASPMPSMQLHKIDAEYAIVDGLKVPVAHFLAEHDIVVNCVLQDTDHPLMFVAGNDLAQFAPGSLIVDVSCDEGMGFDFARPTSFAEPMFTVGNGVRYYAVDHTPSLLWDSASWEISEALLPYLATVLGGPAAWAANDTVRRSIEIDGGVIQNPAILSFQHRAPEYPHVALS